MIELRVSALVHVPGSMNEMAAGSKQAVRLRNKTLIRSFLDEIIAAGIKDTVVVAGPGSAVSMKDFRGLPVRFSVNRSNADDISESVRTGLLTLGDSPTGVLLCLADRPPASRTTMRSLALDHYSFCEKILVPVCQGKPGHPMLFPLRVMMEVQSGLTVQDLIRNDSRRVRLLSVPDRSVILDSKIRSDFESTAKQIVA